VRTQDINIVEMYSLSEIPESERREIARRYIDSLESWLRRIIEHRLIASHGDLYWKCNSNGNPVVPPKILAKITQRASTEPKRYPRWIDAAQLDEAVRIIFHNYESEFEAVFSSRMPKIVVRRFLDAVTSHRNPLMHAGTCSVRMLEQVACYSNDIIDVCKEYFAMENAERKFNSPTFTRFCDSKGNVFEVKFKEGNQNIFDARGGAAGELHVGDSLTFEVQVDESYPVEDYEVHWYAFWGGQKGQGAIFSIDVTLKNVGEQEEIRATLVSKKAWHRLGRHDDMISVLYRVLPTAD
jgi:hypothetical protein